ncbi:YfiR family protein [Niastella caeni]|uniref:YfiR family protein n=1 Tax=Niastella caeni TaxID=2569763 RepID=A0A4V4GZU8_9BACT|nr:YfiR family protein [Niastella caeni]THU34036.1 YfiR family protein [Niastella caeni]
MKKYFIEKRDCIHYMKYKTVLLSLFLFCSFTLQQEKNKASEYNLKAAFIFNFTKYIEWKTATSENEFIIGIMGPSPINDPLVEIVKTETVDNKKIIIKQFNKPADISFCNILFISQSSSASLDDILAKTVHKGMLIISEQEGYAEQGTAINFVIVNRKLKFEANVKAINTAGLTASSQLLKLAIIIK